MNNLNNEGIRKINRKEQKTLIMLERAEIFGKGPARTDFCVAAVHSNDNMEVLRRIKPNFVKEENLFDKFMEHFNEEELQAL